MNLQFHLIAGPRLQEKDQSLLHEFERGIFLPSFPDDDERESLQDDILPRILDHTGDVATYAVLLVDEDGHDGPRVVAGEICDWYPACCDLEVIYVAVNPDVRGGGFGSRILQEGTARIVEAAEKEFSCEVRRVYFETEHPDKPQKGNPDPAVLQERVRFFGKNGGSVVLEEYYQPPLSEGKGWADNMMLCTLPVFRLKEDRSGVEEAEGETVVKSAELFQFLTLFYQGLDHADETPEGKESMARMKAVSGGGEYVTLERIEAYAFLFPYATVSSHFFIEADKKQLDYDVPDKNIQSYECDLMRYGLQEYQDRPVVTHHYRLLKGVTLHLPNKYQYSSEGETFTVRQWGRQELTADASFNWSYHRKTGQYMATLVLSPSEGYYFSGLDVLKLIAIFGFGSRQEGFVSLDPLRIRFSLDGKEGEVTSFEDFVQTVFQLDKRPVKTSTGITEIDLLDMQGEKEFDDFSGLKAQVLCPGPKESLWNKTLCGLMLGIFDYRRMNEGEIADTVRPFQVRDTYFMQLCRGNLVQIRFNASDERIDNTLTSVYLIIPSVVLAYNEEILRKNKARLKELEANEGLVEKGEKTISDFKRYSFLSGEVKKLETSLAEEYVRDVFQYDSEQTIMREGDAQRNLANSMERIQEGIRLRKSQAKEYKEKYTSSVDTIQNIILLMLAILQIATIKSTSEVSPFAWVLLGLSLVGGLYFFLRKRKM